MSDTSSTTPSPDGEPVSEVEEFIPSADGDGADEGIADFDDPEYSEEVD